MKLLVVFLREWLRLSFGDVLKISAFFNHARFLAKNHTDEEKPKPIDLSSPRASPPFSLSFPPFSLLVGGLRAWAKKNRQTGPKETANAEWKWRWSKLMTSKLGRQTAEAKKKEWKNLGEILGGYLVFGFIGRTQRTAAQNRSRVINFGNFTTSLIKSKTVNWATVCTLAIKIARKLG